MDTPRLAVVELVVADMAASLAFYRRLGLEAPADADGAPHVEIELGAGLRLAFDTVETIHSFAPDWTPPTGGPRSALAFDCGTPADVDAVYAELTDAGYHGETAPWDAPWGMRYATVHDPDGGSVDLFALRG
jgi:catechol 2,3-dioxygenase-like lactoylglutathione lyase family enzyme